jgi:hypothetical protein
MTEKRIHRRFGPLVIKTFFTAGSDRREGYLTNVSEGGAFLAVEDPPPLGARVEIRAVLPWRLGELRAAGRVAWRCGVGRAGRGGLAGAGLTFEDLGPEAKALLGAYLEKFTQLAAQIDELREE